jgi:threonine dehydrogenase-like Zn-dependent dehydrogenase
MKAAVFYGPKDLRIEERSLPRLGDNEVLIRVKAASICGTDLHIFNGDLAVKTPLVLGHDFSGVIEEAEKGVNHFQKGDQVIAHIVRYCGECLFCRQGRYNLCLKNTYMGFGVDGAFAEYVVAPARDVILIPPGVSLEEAAITEPIVVALRVMDFVQPRIGKTMAIFGQGPIGLVQTQVAKLTGLYVIAIDPLEERLKLAEGFGADHVLNPRKMDIVDSIFKLTDGIGVNCAVEDSGSQEAIDLVSEVTRPGGKILFVGEGTDLHGPMIQHQERVFVEVLVDPWKYPLALKLLAEKRVDVRSLITHEIKLDEIVDLFRDLSEGRGRLKAVKVLVKP